ncbi:UDP-glucuronosyltransferase 2C1-like isoform X1, partial [Clarias magur]
KPTTLCETIGKADIWLIRTYWDFEYPRPLLPNFKFVGGLHCKPAKPLPNEMEEFVQSSGDDGIVVFSLGSLIKNITKEKVNTIALALSQIPQKVLWGYAGEKPETLAPNIKIYDWIPQNDLLGHPKTKAFVTHGGTNGIYEAIYHGVPMVGLPLFIDQPDNMNHMKTKGAAVVLDFFKMESKDLIQALKEVINNPLFPALVYSMCELQGKVLVWPAEFSHWLTIKIIINELISRGHNVTVVTHSATPSVTTDPSPGYNVEIVQVPHSKKDMMDTVNKVLTYFLYDLPNTSKIQALLKLLEFIGEMFEQNEVFCKKLFTREDLLEKLRKEQFDVVLTDPNIICGDLLAQKLNLPLVYSIRFTFASMMARMCGQLPAPPSYVPAVGLLYTDQMDFLQRVKNILFIVFNDMMFNLMARQKWNHFYTEVIDPSPGYNVEIIQVPHSKKDIKDTVNNALKFFMYDHPNTNTVHALLKFSEIMDEMFAQNRVFCRELFAREDLLEKLKQEQFDVVLTDPIVFCGDLLAQKLNLPFITSMRFTFASVITRMCGQLPAPPSYVPAVGLLYTDQMDFLQRVKNILFIVFNDVMSNLMARQKWDHLYTEVMGFLVWLSPCVSYKADCPTVMSACGGAALCLLFLFGLIQSPTCVTAGKILVWPAEFSHWLNIKVIIDELIARGHNVTVITHSATPSITTDPFPGYNVEIVQVPHSKKDMIDTLNRLLKYWTYEWPNTNMIEAVLKLIKIIDNMVEQNHVFCRELFAREDLLEKLRKEQFDVLLTDPIVVCGELLAEKLNLPFIHSLRFSFGSVIERTCGQLPAPSSYVPSIGLLYTDHMDFPQRVKNMLFNIFNDIVFNLMARVKWDHFYTEVMAGKVLIWPAEYSHWLNIKVIIDELIARGHNVTVVTHSATPSIPTDPSQNYNVEIVQVPYSKKDAIDVWNKILTYWTYDLPNTNIIQAVLKLTKIIDNMVEQNRVFCRELFAHKDLLEKWRKEQFDVLLTDPIVSCGELLAEKLNLPVIHSLRFTFGSVMERTCGQLPAPPSYVPSVGLLYTDHMDFLQRVKNILFIVFNDIVFNLMARVKWNQFYTEVMGKPTTLCESLGKADIWLIRTYWDFEYPRPLLPNFKFVGGLHCKPAKPLPKEMEDFVQSSGNDGIVVFSLGSMVKNLTKDRANAIASALGQIPQKVLWRYAGKKPETLGPNTRIYDWIPQNDLLGHPKTKAFVTHAGTNGLYEAIHHGVPMVGLPLFGDQHDNIFHMQTKGAAIVLDFNKMESKDLTKALNDVINNPS